MPNPISDRAFGVLNRIINDYVRNPADTLTANEANRVITDIFDSDCSGTIDTADEMGVLNEVLYADLTTRPLNPAQRERVNQIRQQLLMQLYSAQPRVTPVPLAVPGLYDIRNNPRITDPFRLMNGDVESPENAMWSRIRMGNAGRRIDLNTANSLRLAQQALTNQGVALNAPPQARARALVTDFWRNPDSSGRHVFRMEEIHSVMAYINSLPPGEQAAFRETFFSEMTQYITNPANGLNPQFVMDSLLGLLGSTDWSDPNSHALGNFVGQLATGIARNAPAGTFNNQVIGNYDSTIHDNGLFNSIAFVKGQDGNYYFVNYRTGVSGIGARYLVDAPAGFPGVLPPVLPVPPGGAPPPGGIAPGGGVPVVPPAPAGGPIRIPPIAPNPNGTITFNPPLAPGVTISEFRVGDDTQAFRAAGSNVGGVRINADGNYSIDAGRVGHRVTIKTTDGRTFETVIGSDFSGTSTIQPGGNVNIPNLAGQDFDFRVTTPGAGGSSSNWTDRGGTIPPGAPGAGITVNNDGRVTVPPGVPFGTKIEVTVPDTGMTRTVVVEPNFTEDMNVAFGLAPGAVFTPTATPGGSIDPGANLRNVPLSIAPNGSTNFREIGNDWLDLGNGSRVRRSADGRLEFDIANPSGGAAPSNQTFQLRTSGGQTYDIDVDATDVTGVSRDTTVAANNGNGRIDLPVGARVDDIILPGPPPVTVAVGPGVPGAIPGGGTVAADGTVTGLPVGQRTIQLRLEDGRIIGVNLDRPVDVATAAPVATPADISGANALNIDFDPAVDEGITQVTPQGGAGVNIPVGGALTPVGGAGLQVSDDGSLVAPDYRSNGTYTFRLEDAVGGDRNVNVNVNVPLRITGVLPVNTNIDNGWLAGATVIRITRVGGATVPVGAGAPTQVVPGMTITQVGALGVTNNSANGTYIIELSDGRRLTVQVTT